jgi:hypothetical protein
VRTEKEPGFFERRNSKTKGSAARVQFARRCRKRLRESVKSYLSYFKQTSSW